MYCQIAINSTNTIIYLHWTTYARSVSFQKCFFNQFSFFSLFYFFQKHQFYTLYIYEYVLCVQCALLLNDFNFFIDITWICQPEFRLRLHWFNADIFVGWHTKLEMLALVADAIIIIVVITTNHHHYETGSDQFCTCNNDEHHYRFHPCSTGKKKEKKRITSTSRESNRSNTRRKKRKN